MATNEGYYQLSRASGRGNKLTVGNLSVTGQGTATIYLHNFQNALATVELASNVYEFARITSKTTPSLILNVSTSAAVSTTARTVHFLLLGNME